MPVACEYPDLEDWTQIQDAELRKRIQNRLSQRRHREKIRKQNGASVNAISSRKARSETAPAPPGSSSASRSASPLASSNTSGQDGINSNNEERVLDTWDNQADDDLAFNVDWNEFTFLDGPTMDNDALFSFPSNLQTYQLLPPTYTTQTHPQLTPSNDGYRPCSCGARTARVFLDNNAPRLSQYHALSNLAQLNSPAPWSSMTISGTPLSSAQSPDRVYNNLTLDTRTTRAASERAYRPKAQRTSTCDSAIELPMLRSGDDRKSSLAYSSSRKRPRPTTIIDSNAHPSPVETKRTTLLGTGEGTLHSQEDDIATLQCVGEVSADFGQDDGPAMKRQNRGSQGMVSPRSEDQISDGT